MAPVTLKIDQKYNFSTWSKKWRHRHANLHDYPVKCMNKIDHNDCVNLPEQKKLTIIKFPFLWGASKL